MTAYFHLNLYFSFFLIMYNIVYDSQPYIHGYFFFPCLLVFSFQLPHIFPPWWKLKLIRMESVIKNDWRMLKSQLKSVNSCVCYGRGNKVNLPTLNFLWGITIVLWKQFLSISFSCNQVLSSDQKSLMTIIHSEVFYIIKIWWTKVTSRVKLRACRHSSVTVLLLWSLWH